MEINLRDEAHQYARRADAAKVLGIHPDTLARFRRNGRYNGLIRMARFGKNRETRYNIIDVFALAFPSASEDKRAELIYTFIMNDRTRIRNGAKAPGGRRENETLETDQAGQPKDAGNDGATEFGHLRVPGGRESRLEEIRRKARDLQAADIRRKAGLPAGDIPPGSSRSGQLLDLYAQPLRGR